MVCYQCGAQVGKAEQCPTCGADLRIFQRVLRISNAYYNDGLQKASVRNLSGAVISLKASLKFNKYHIDARNLLGLVYYETGETVAALSEWVISKSYQPDNNRASVYLDAVQKNQSQLNAINQTIKKYNQALIYCKNGSRDLAIIQLKKVLSLNPRLIQGHQLLALLYLKENQLDKAKKELRCAAKIDTNNTITLRYMKEVNELLKSKSTIKKKKQEDLISYQSGNETIIMPKRFRESSIGSTLTYILLGLVVGTAVTAFLIVPNVQNEAREEAKRQLLEASDTISTNGQTISDLEKQIEQMQVKLDEAKEKNDEVQTQFSSYENLLKAFEIYTSGDILATGKMLDKIDTSYLSDEAKGTLNKISEDIYDRYMEALYEEGYSYYTHNDFANAIKDLAKVTKHDIDYRDGNAAYYLAQAYNRNGQLDKARKYYQYVIDNYPGSQRARTSMNYVDAQE